MLTNNTDGDWTIITYVDKAYEILIGNNPINYNGIMNEIKLMDNNNNNNNNKLCVDNNDACYKYIRYIYMMMEVELKISVWTFLNIVNIGNDLADLDNEV